MNKKIIIPIVAIAVAVGWVFFSTVKTTEPVACTMEAKLCPDGSAVGRVGPNCEFAKCPPLNGNQIYLKEGQRDGHLLVQKIYSTYITGLNFPEYPVATNQGLPITLNIGEMASNGCTVTLTLVGITEDTATFIEKTDFTRPCPICLAEGALIDTPLGQVPVEQLKQGMPVWTIDKLGKRMATTVIKASKTAAAATHQMVHIMLDDQREIFASPGHPIGDGRVFDNLSVGDIISGGRVITAEKVIYNKGYTYDILPAGATGFYIANGILIDSTLY